MTLHDKKALQGVLIEAEQLFGSRSTAVAAIPATAGETPHQKVFRLVGEGKYEAAAAAAKRLIDVGDVAGFFIHSGLKYEAARDWLDENIEMAHSRRRGGWFSITAERAQVLLELNSGNRKIDAPGLAKRMRDMASGGWSENGETVIVSKCGHLNDGQHRCWAALLLGVSFTTNTSWGVDRESRGTVDSGVKRSAGGQLDILGVPCGKAKTAIVSEYYSIFLGRAASDVEKVDFYFENQKEIDQAYSLTSNRMPARHARAPIGAGLFHLFRIGAQPESVGGFMAVVRTKLGHRGGCPAFAFRDEMLTGKVKRSSRDWSLAAVQHYIEWSRRKKIYKFKIPTIIPNSGDL